MCENDEHLAVHLSLFRLVSTNFLLLVVVLRPRKFLSCFVELGSFKKRSQIKFGFLSSLSLKECFKRMNNRSSDRQRLDQLRAKLDTMVLEETLESESSIRQKKVALAAKAKEEEAAKIAEQQARLEVEQILAQAKAKRQAHQVPYQEPKHPVTATKDVDAVKKLLQDLVKQEELEAKLKARAEAAQQLQQQQQQQQQQQLLQQQQGQDSGASAPTQGSSGTTKTDPLSPPSTDSLSTVAILPAPGTEKTGDNNNSLFAPPVFTLTIDTEGGSGLGSSSAHHYTGLGLPPLTASLSGDSFASTLRSLPTPTNQSVQSVTPMSSGLNISPGELASPGKGSSTGGKRYRMDISPRTPKSRSPFNLALKPLAPLVQPESPPKVPQMTIVEKMQLKHAADLAEARAQNEREQKAEQAYKEMRENLRDQVLREVFGMTAAQLEQKRQQDDAEVRGAPLQDSTLNSGSSDFHLASVPALGVTTVEHLDDEDQLDIEDERSALFEGSIQKMYQQLSFLLAEGGNDVSEPQSPVSPLGRSTTTGTNSPTKSDRKSPSKAQFNSSTLTGKRSLALPLGPPRPPMAESDSLLDLLKDVATKTQVKARDHRYYSAWELVTRSCAIMDPSGAIGTSESQQSFH